MLFTVNVTILNRFKTELPFIYLSNCISLSESRGNISLVGAKCDAAHIPYLRPICVGESGVKRTTGAKRTTHLSVHMRSASKFSK